MEASRANSILTFSCISRSVVTSILASVVIFIHRVFSQFPGGRKPREHLNGFDSQSGSQEYYKLDTRRDFTSTTEILLYIRPGLLALECQLIRRISCDVYLPLEYPLACNRFTPTVLYFEDAIKSEWTERPNACGSL